MKTEKETTGRKTVIVYREGSNWVGSIDGNLTTLPYWVKTRKDVRAYYQGQSELDFCAYVVDFA